MSVKIVTSSNSSRSGKPRYQAVYYCGSQISHRFQSTSLEKLIEMMNDYYRSIIPTSNVSTVDIYLL